MAKTSKPDGGRVVRCRHAEHRYRDTVDRNADQYMICRGVSLDPDRRIAEELVLPLRLPIRSSR